jgi:hypothetical protein
MEFIGGLHALAALFLGKEAPVLIQQQIWWPPEPGREWRRINQYFHSCLELNCSSPAWSLYWLSYLGSFNSVYLNNFQQRKLSSRQSSSVEIDTGTRYKMPTPFSSFSFITDSILINRISSHGLWAGRSVFRLQVTFPENNVKNIMFQLN